MSKFTPEEEALIEWCKRPRPKSGEVYAATKPEFIGKLNFATKEEVGLAVVNTKAIRGTTMVMSEQDWADIVAWTKE